MVGRTILSEALSITETLEIDNEVGGDGYPDDEVLMILVRGGMAVDVGLLVRA